VDYLAGIWMKQSKYDEANQRYDIAVNLGSAEVWRREMAALSNLRYREKAEQLFRRFRRGIDMPSAER